MKLSSFAIRILLWLHKRAERTPYFHLAGYMRRDWILGYRHAGRNSAAPTPFCDQVFSTNALYNWLVGRVCIRAHTIVRSDNDRHQHDHPCASISIVLAGGYWEALEPPDFVQYFPEAYARLLELLQYEPVEKMHVKANVYNVWWRAPGDVVRREAKTRHKLILPIATQCKTIFIMGRKSNAWGFYTETGKVGYREYLGIGDVT